MLEQFRESSNELDALTKQQRNIEEQIRNNVTVKLVSYLHDLFCSAYLDDEHSIMDEDDASMWCVGKEHWMEVADNLLIFMNGFTETEKSTRNSRKLKLDK